MRCMWKTFCGSILDEEERKKAMLCGLQIRTSHEEANADAQKRRQWMLDLDGVDWMGWLWSD